jgi:hypothetical protein
MKFKKGVIENFQVHKNTTSSNVDNREKVCTIFQHTFVIDDQAMSFAFNSPVNARDGDTCSVAFKSRRDGGKVRSLKNKNNGAYYGADMWPLLVAFIFFVAASIGIQWVSLPSVGRFDFVLMKNIISFVSLILAAISLSIWTSEKRIEHRLSSM